jgi:hypothetical protein
VSQEARGTSIANIFAEVHGDGTDPSREGERDSAARLLRAVASGSPELRDAALIAPDGTQIASTDGADWSAGCAALWAAAEVDGASRATQIHVGTEAGEVFSVREAGTVVVATSERFALASLMLCDLRALLRDLRRQRETGTAVEG